MKTILAYRFSAFGDVAMTIPVIKEFLEQNQGVRIVFLSRKNFADLFDEIPNLEFKGIDFDNYKGLFGLRRLGKEVLKEYEFDYIADFHDVIRSKILTRFLKKNKFKNFVIDKGKEDKEQLTDVWNIDKKPLKTTVERYADVFRKMGFSLNLSHQLRPKAVEKKGVGIAPFAQHRGKMLPIELSFEITKIVAEEKPVYLFGGGNSEIEILQQWEKQIPNVINLSGKLTLKQELERISKLELMFSMDSANMHLASLVGTRCVSFWGSTHIYAGFLGFGQSESDVIQVSDLTCRPCSVFGDKECYRGDWACLNEINIQKILEKIGV